MTMTQLRQVIFACAELFSFLPILTLSQLIHCHSPRIVGDGGLSRCVRLFVSGRSSSQDDWSHLFGQNECQADKETESSSEDTQFVDRNPDSQSLPCTCCATVPDDDALLISVSDLVAVFFSGVYACMYLPFETIC